MPGHADTLRLLLYALLPFVAHAAAALRRLGRPNASSLGPSAVSRWPSMLPQTGCFRPGPRHPRLGVARRRMTRNEDLNRVSDSASLAAVTVGALIFWAVPAQAAPWRAPKRSWTTVFRGRAAPRCFHGHGRDFIRPVSVSDSDRPARRRRSRAKGRVPSMRRTPPRGSLDRRREPPPKT